MVKEGLEYFLPSANYSLWVGFLFYLFILNYIFITFSEGGKHSWVQEFVVLMQKPDCLLKPWKSHSKWEANSISKQLS